MGNLGRGDGEDNGIITSEKYARTPITNTLNRRISMAEDFFNVNILILSRTRRPCIK